MGGRATATSSPTLAPTRTRVVPASANGSTASSPIRRRRRWSQGSSRHTSAVRALYAITEDLTRDGIPSPSAHDPARNRHRSSSGGAWGKSAVRAILANPRYTGRQVWNRQRRDEVPVDVEDVALGHETKLRWNDPSDWVWSAKQTHEALVDADTFAAAQRHLGLQHAPSLRDEEARYPPPVPNSQPHSFRRLWSTDAGNVEQREAALPLPLPGRVRLGREHRPPEDGLRP